MGFFSYAPGRAKRDPFHGISAEFMQASGCSSCPLRDAKKAPPSGPEQCTVYILGEAPGAEEAAQGKPFVGASGRLLRKHIPAPWLPLIRMNNVVMSHPPRLPSGKQSAPSAIATAHCRGYLIADIEQAAPVAIIGLGNVPLQALTGHTGINRYAGRRMPVKIGNHSCWYFPLGHPAAVLHADQRDREDLEHQFRWRLQRALAVVDKLPAPVIVTPEAARAGIQVLGDAEQVVRFLDRAAKRDRVGLDFETSGLSPYAADARLLSVGLATGQETVAFPLDHSGAGWSKNERSAIYAALRGMLQAPVEKVAHNAAFDMAWALSVFGPAAARPTSWGDSLGQAFLLDTRPRAHSLDFLCQVHFGLALKQLSKLDVAHLDAAPVADVCRYNALDARFCLAVFERQQPLLEKQGLLPLYRHHMARVAALVRCQHRGLPVDLQVNADLVLQYTTQLTKIEKTLAALPEVIAFGQGGTRFNIASTKHVAQVAGIDTRQKFTTAEPHLQALNTPFTRSVLSWRRINKTLATYLKPLAPDSPLVTDGRLHPTISSTHTRTWRTAAQDPNIQNFPKREQRDKAVRKQIVADPGCQLVSVDYSSIQARNVAMESKDARLVQAFIDHYDIHRDWSERVQRLVRGWAKGRDQKALRNAAKNELVFPLFFGAQPASVANYLGVDSKYGYSLYDAFWNEFPDIHLWHDDLRTFYKRHHYVTGLSGFRRHAPISSNMLVNTPIQGDEALLVCEAMARLSQYEDDALQCVAMVHDDLVFQIPVARHDECVEIILHEMLRMEHPWLNVPLAVEVNVGPNWAEQQKVGHFESVGDGGFVQLI